jgi:integral membrane protein (TIGR01906 family)
MNSIAGRAGSLVIGVATALVILAVTMPLFLNPFWVHFEQGRAEAAAWTGFSDADLGAATDSILADLVIGPPDFDVSVGGQVVLDLRERAHMRDVRAVFIGFFALTAMLAVAAVIIAAGRRRRPGGTARSWRAVRGGAIGLIAALVAAGLTSLVAFDALFEIFHQIFFPGGSYTFDPATERLVQLFPFVFWQETTIVLGVVAIVIAAIVAVVADRRSNRATSVVAADAATPPTAAPGVASPVE